MSSKTILFKKSLKFPENIVAISCIATMASQPDQQLFIGKMFENLQGNCLTQLDIKMSYKIIY
jgi:hypothetical protein